MTNSAPDNEASPPRRRRWSWWNVLLVVSLAFNLLIIGGAIARFYHPGPGHGMGMTHMRMLPRQFFAELDRSRRQELLAVLENYRTRFEDRTAATRNLATALADALQATPYDEARVRAAIEAFSKSGVELAGLANQSMMDFIAHLSPEERVLLAQSIRNQSNWFEGRRFKHRP